MSLRDLALLSVFANKGEKQGTMWPFGYIRTAFCFPGPCDTWLVVQKKKQCLVGRWTLRHRLFCTTKARSSAAACAAIGRHHGLRTWWSTCGFRVGEGGISFRLLTCLHLLRWFRLSKETNDVLHHPHNCVHHQPTRHSDHFGE